MLIMDQKVTTQQVLGELDDRGVKFLTLRMRSPALIRHINSLAPPRLQDDHPGPARPTQPAPRARRPPGHPDRATPAPSANSSSPDSAATPPTVIITNDHDITDQSPDHRYARRMTIEQRLAEIIRAFCADALSSTVNLNVDLDIMLCVLAQALLAALRARLAGYATRPPTPSNAASSKPPARSSPTTTRSPSASTDAPTHPSCAKPHSPDTTVPWWGTAPSTSSTPNVGPNLLRGNPR